MARHGTPRRGRVPRRGSAPLPRRSRLGERLLTHRPQLFVELRDERAELFSLELVTHRASDEAGETARADPLSDGPCEIAGNADRELGGAFRHRSFLPR